MQGDLVRGHLEGLLLATLRDSPAHGYLIMQRLRELSHGAFDLPEGTIYPVLRRLEHRGLLLSRWDDGSGRKRRIYRLSPAGRRELSEAKRKWAGFTRAVDAVLGGSS